MTMPSTTVNRPCEAVLDEIENVWSSVNATRSR